jgi:hypothetical protein
MESSKASRESNMPTNYQDTTRPASSILIGFGPQRLQPLPNPTARRLLNQRDARVCF